MKHHRPLLAVLALALIASCSDPPSNSINGLDPPRLPLDTDVTVEIIGEGTVYFAGGGNHAPCAGGVGDGTSKMCDKVAFGDTDGEVRALPAEGWRIQSWSEGDKPMPDAKPVDGAPDAGIQTVRHGSTGTRITVRFVRKKPLFSVSPIRAVFNQPAQSTTYSADVTNPNNAAITFAWTGPNCGEHTPNMPSTGAFSGTTTMTWHHPHPNCDPSTDHASVRVGFTVAGPSGVVVCHYNGAHDGVGPACE